MRRCGGSQPSLKMGGGRREWELRQVIVLEMESEDERGEKRRFEGLVKQVNRGEKLSAFVYRSHGSRGPGSITQQAGGGGQQSRLAPLATVLIWPSPLLTG